MYTVYVIFAKYNLIISVLFRFANTNFDSLLPHDDTEYIALKANLQCSM